MYYEVCACCGCVVGGATAHRVSDACVRCVRVCEGVVVVSWALTAQGLAGAADGGGPLKGLLEGPEDTQDDV